MDISNLIKETYHIPRENPLFLHDGNKIIPCSYTPYEAYLERFLELDRKEIGLLADYLAVKRSIRPSTNTVLQSENLTGMYIEDARRVSKPLGNNGRAVGFVASGLTYDALIKQVGNDYLTAFASQTLDDAVDILIKGHLRLVVSIAKKYDNFGTRPDTIQNGNLGLIDAIETYDYKRGAFTTHATTHIKKAIIRLSCDTYNEHEIRPPSDAGERLPALIRIIGDFNDDIPTDKIAPEVAKQFSITKKKARQVVNAFRISYLDQTHGDEDDDHELTPDHQADYIQPDGNTIEQEALDSILSGALVESVGSLGPDMQNLIKLHYGHNVSLKKIASMMNKSPKQILSLRDKALDILRVDPGISRWS